MSDDLRQHVSCTAAFLPEHIPLSCDENEAIRKLLKAGIYKELHRRKMITGTQLYHLLNQI